MKAPVRGRTTLNNPRPGVPLNPMPSNPAPPLARFESGDLITADRLNEIIDAIHLLEARLARLDR